MSNRSLVRAAALALLVAGCRSQVPQVGAPVKPPEQPEPGLRLTISGATIAGGKIRASFALSRDGARLTAADAEALGIGWTVAALETEPVDGAPAWRSLLVNDPARQVIPSLPVAGPETPAAAVLTNQRQPGIDQGGTYADATSVGIITYTFGAPDAADVAALESTDETIRVGAFVRAGEEVSAGTSSTHDFRGDGGTILSRREVVVDADCQSCHAAVRGHQGTRTGTRLCVTCHTWQHADPDTADPAAPNAATAATNPNPLEFGRLVHRIHRGKNLPTLFKSNPAVLTNPMAGQPPPFTQAPPLPFLPNSSARGNVLVAGRKFAVVGERSRERVYARTVTRWDVAGVGSRLVAEGVAFPRDLRHCDACHARAAEGSVAVTELSRRSCQSCHADVYFGEWSAGVTDENHFPHTGGPVIGDDADARCTWCHGPQGTYVRIGDVHVPPYLHPRYDHLQADILGVEGMKATPVGTPATDIYVSFALTDEKDAVTPLGAPDLASDPAFPIARALLNGKSSGLSFFLAGPTTDYTAPSNKYLSESIPLLDADGVPLPGTEADGNGVFRVKLASKLPEGATGTWSVALTAGRSNTTEPYFYDVQNDRFTWPYTGETVRETADNPIAFVDVASGLFGEGLERRRIVAQERCNACHLRLTMHGTRNSVGVCVMCHAPDKTDWNPRPKSGDAVNLSATYDGIEERSTHFKVMMHRLHTGGRRGSAELSAIRPFAMYLSSPFFFDAAAYPNDLAKCTACHIGSTYTVEAVPSTAAPTTANETATLLHVETAAHPTEGDACPSVPPVTAACVGCHATAGAIAHAGKYIADGKEACTSCHGATASYGVAKVHGLTAP